MKPFTEDRYSGEIVQTRDDITLRERVRELLRDGRLPNRRPESMWAGRGRGESCRLCGAVVEQDEVVYEVEFTSESDRGAEGSHFHMRCFWALDRELRELESAGR